MRKAQTRLAHFSLVFSLFSARKRQLTKTRVRRQAIAKPGNPETWNLELWNAREALLTDDKRAF